MATSISDDGPHTYLICSGSAGAGSVEKLVFRTAGVGSGWQRLGRPPLAGGPAGLSAGSDRAIVIAASSGASELYRSADGGRTWQTALVERDGGAGWADLGFTTAIDGVVIHGPAIRDGEGDGRPGQLLLTDDGGRTWRRVRFRLP
jgi:photosystem II stability/assembly factor-like uncharacterized protein